MKYLLYILLLTFLCSSCSQNKRDIKTDRLLNQYVIDNFENYSDCYIEISLLLNEMVDSNLKVVRPLIVCEDFEIDSLILFNKTKDRLFTTINTKIDTKYATSDRIQALYGVKIDGKWHIYNGEILLGIRQPYKYETNEPFTWQEMSFVAREHFHIKFIDFSLKGNIKIDHDQIDKRISPFDIIGTQIKLEGTDEDKYRSITEYRKSQVVDSVEIKKMYARKDDPPPLILPRRKKINWWDKLRGKEELLFESKEWKAYLKERKSIEK